jgi:hypothetical protein
MFGPTIRTVYREVSVNATRTGKCRFCGKRMVQKRKLCQTINPFNKNKDGEIKNSYEIREELAIERKEWQSVTDIIHDKCRYLEKEKLKDSGFKMEAR